MTISDVLFKGFPNQQFKWVETIQDLWSGYGSIQRWASNESCVIVKHIKFPTERMHSRGWNSEFGHLRKVRSYEVERYWYSHYAKYCPAKLPKLLFKDEKNGEQFLVLEDLNSTGFAQRVVHPSFKQINYCLDWMAQFHAYFLESSNDGLWDEGTYWNLDSRPEEFENMQKGNLKNYASVIDYKLRNARYQTIVHGDAKMANFCFSKTDSVAAVDFQYVGRGCGIKDVIYFLSSIQDDELIQNYDHFVNYYFEKLGCYIGRKNNKLEKEWRGLYKFAWADFNRFLKGWSPGHWKINSYVEEITDEAINEITQELMFREVVGCFKKAAIKAGKYIQENINSTFSVRFKRDDLSDASRVLTSIDLAAQTLIFDEIEQVKAKYDFGILSEEHKDDNSRFNKAFFICVDPLDGTLPFTEKVAGYSVSIALVTQSGDAVCGVIYDPVGENVYSAYRGGGGFKNSIPIELNYTSSVFTFICDRSFSQSSDYELLLQKLSEKNTAKGVSEVKVISHGGAAMNAIWCIEHAPAVYAKPPKIEEGGGSIWDFAASTCIFHELGLRASDYKGEALDLNRKGSTFMNHKGVWFQA